MSAHAITPKGMRHSHGVGSRIAKRRASRLAIIAAIALAACLAWLALGAAGAAVIGWV